MCVDQTGDHTPNPTPITFPCGLAISPKPLLRESLGDLPEPDEEKTIDHLLE
jgi:hypothetical protein